MKILFKTALLSSFIFLVGCSEDQTNNSDNTTTPNETNSTSSPVQLEQSATDAPAKEDMPLEMKSAQSPAENTEVKLNPPHGQPGHDCAVAVGAPLNGSAPAANSMNIQNNSNAQEIPHPSAPFNMNAPMTTGSVAEGTNPPHGQPGHDCAIPVGAPLNQ